MSQLQALLFDVDGTLADTERDGHRVAFNRAFKEAGLDWEWPEALYGELLAVTGGKERIRHYIDQHQPDFQCPNGSSDPGNPNPCDLSEYIATLHAAKTQHYTALLAKGDIPLRPGVERLFIEAREAGLRLALATTTTPANVTALLTHTLGPDSESWFEVIAAGDVVPAKKPAADIYVYAMEKMALTPGACMAFEDSVHGLSAARGAGLETIITVNGYTQEQDFSGASIVLDHMGEPDHPFQVLSGDAHGSDYLDVALVRKLHAAARPA